MGTNVTLSELLFFRTYPEVGSSDHSVWQPNVAIYGDMGWVNAQSLPRLQKATFEGKIDMVLHIGDFAYNLPDVKAKHSPSRFYGYFHCYFILYVE